MIKEQLLQLKTEIPKDVILVAVSKTKSKEDILEAYKAGQIIFGENRIQELTEKQVVLPNDIKWHMIGHLQSNKVKYIAPFVSLIHAVDSLSLLKEINKQAEKNGRIISCLLQFHIADEHTKFGMTIDEARSMIDSKEFSELKNIDIAGVMGMATFTDNEEQIRMEFRTLKKHFELLKNEYFSSNSHFKQISMGMSGDYKIAIEQGSTMIRVGSSIFGTR